MTRYQAHPIVPDEDYELRPDDARRDIGAAMLAAAVLILLAVFAAAWPRLVA